MNKLSIVAFLSLGLAALQPFGAAAAPGLNGKLPSPLLFAGGGRAGVLGVDGKVVWEQKNCGNIHRVWRQGDDVYFSNGNLFKVTLPGHKAELVYRPAAQEGGGVYGYQVLPNGNLLVAENSSDSVVEFAAGTTNEIVRFKVNARNAQGKMPGAHAHLRMIAKTAAGTYLVCCSGGNVVREYDAKGKLVWEQAIPNSPLTFDALRRANGNTLVSHLVAVTEYTPDHKIAWEFKCSDAPELKLGNLCGLQELPNGDLVIGSYSNGAKDGSRTTVFQVTRDKKIVWSYASKEDHSMMTAFLISKF